CLRFWNTAARSSDLSKPYAIDVWTGLCREPCSGAPFRSEWSKVVVMPCRRESCCMGLQKCIMGAGVRPSGMPRALTGGHAAAYPAVFTPVLQPAEGEARVNARFADVLEVVRGRSVPLP